MLSNARKPLVHVAAGVLIRADGRVLLAERPANKSSGGHWEFPGGKLDAGEDVWRALLREVEEEVGVAIDMATPWLTYDHEYEDKIVRLHIFKVASWHGTARGRESQRISWEDPRDLGVTPLMEAYGAAIEALRLPTVIAEVFAEDFSRAELLTRIEGALRGGLRMMVLRARGMVPAQFAQLARRVADMTNRHEAMLLIDGARAPAAKGSVAGVHIARAQLSRMGPPPPGAVWSVSCADPRELDRAAALGASFALVELATPENDPKADWEAFSGLIRGSALPVYASGDLGASDIDAALRAGAHGLALPLSAW